MDLIIEKQLSKKPWGIKWLDDPARALTRLNCLNEKKIYRKANIVSTKTKLHEFYKHNFVKVDEMKQR